MSEISRVTGIETENLSRLWMVLTGSGIQSRLDATTKDRSSIEHPFPNVNRTDARGLFFASARRCKFSPLPLNNPLSEAPAPLSPKSRSLFNLKLDLDTGEVREVGSLSPSYCLEEEYHAP